MELAVGNIYEGRVTGITKFGAFVVLESGKSGLVHISEIANSYVSDISEHVKQGQKLKVMVLSITEDGKINLSIKRAEQEAKVSVPEPPPRTFPSPAIHSKYTMAPATSPRENDSNLNFEDRLKKFMQESDSRIADSRQYSDRKQRNRRR